MRRVDLLLEELHGFEEGVDLRDHGTDDRVRLARAARVAGLPRLFDAGLQVGDVGGRQAAEPAGREALELARSAFQNVELGGGLGESVVRLPELTIDAGFDQSGDLGDRVFDRRGEVAALPHGLYGPAVQVVLELVFAEPAVVLGLGAGVEEGPLVEDDAEDGSVALFGARMELLREAVSQRDSLAGAVLDGFVAVARHAVEIRVGLARRVADQQHRPVRIRKRRGEGAQRVFPQADVADDVEMGLRPPQGDDLADRACEKVAVLRVSEQQAGRLRSERRCEGQGEGESGAGQPAPGRDEERAAGSSEGLGHFYSGSPPSRSYTVPDVNDVGAGIISSRPSTSCTRDLTPWPPLLKERGPKSLSPSPLGEGLGVRSHGAIRFLPAPIPWHRD